MDSLNPNYREHLRDERNHMEGLLNQRFNFFILVLGFILAAIPYVNNVPQLRLILITGFLVELSFTLLIGRSQRRLLINMKLLDELGGDPSTEIRKRAKLGFGLNPFRFSVVRLMGYYIPVLTTLILLVSIFIADEIYKFFQ